MSLNPDRFSNGLNCWMQDRAVYYVATECCDFSCAHSWSYPFLIVLPHLYTCTDSELPHGGAAVEGWLNILFLLMKPSITEAAIHAICFTVKQGNTDAVFIVDANNTFNTVNWQTTQQNITLLHNWSLWVGVVSSLKPTAWTYVEMFVGGKAILPLDRTVYDCSLAMAMHALTSMVLHTYIHIPNLLLVFVGSNTKLVPHVRTHMSLLLRCNVFDRNCVGLHCHRGT